MSEARVGVRFTSQTDCLDKKWLFFNGGRVRTIQMAMNYIRALRIWFGEDTLMRREMGSEMQQSGDSVGAMSEFMLLCETSLGARRTLTQRLYVAC
jgi:hypothetical protein